MKLTTLRSNFPLIIIVFIAVFLRFYQLGNIPVSLYWDETAFGYNAFSLLQTGRDEYGQYLPLLLRSFDDYKLAGYAYLSIPFIKLFGLNEFSIRAVSALLGSFSVLSAYFLLRELLKLNQGILLFNKYSKQIALLSSLSLAISPWHLQFSRAGYEANAGLFFIITGAWLLLKGLKNEFYYYLSIILFGISFYMYRGAHIFVPLLILGIFLLFQKKLKLKKIIIGIFVLSITLVVLVPQLLSENALRRNFQVSITSNADEQIMHFSEKIVENNNSFISRIIYNRRIVYLKIFVQNFISHFNYRYLFADGDQFPRHGVFGMGILYWWELPFLIIGALWIFLHSNRKFKGILLIWLIAGLLPASLATPAPHALRSLYVLPIPQIITSIGIMAIFGYIPKTLRLYYVSLLMIVIAGFLTYYLKLYYTTDRAHSAADWGYGHKQMAEYVLDHENDYERIIITGHYWKPYIYLLFYSKYDPDSYQKSGSSQMFSKYKFGGTGWGENEVELDKTELRNFAETDNALIIVSPEENNKLKESLFPIGSIEGYNREDMFILGQFTNEQK